MKMKSERFKTNQKQQFIPQYSGTVQYSQYTCKVSGKTSINTSILSGFKCKTE